MFEKSNGKESPKIEVNFILRDKNGNPTVIRKSFGSNSGKDLAQFYNKHQAYRAKGKKGNSGGSSSKGKK